MEQAAEAAAAPLPPAGEQASFVTGTASDSTQHYGQEQMPQGPDMWSGLSGSGPPFGAVPQGTMQGGIMTGEGGMLYPQLSTVGMTPHPIGTSEWHAREEPPQSAWGQLMSISPCCPGYHTQSTTESMFQPSGDEHYMWRWTREGKLQLTCGQPIVPVPVIQEVHRRDKIIEVPQVDVLDAVKPKVFNQGVEHEVPVMQIQAEREDFDIKQFKYVETQVVVPIVTGFTHKFVPKWEIREVPRPVVKYVGKQEIIEVEVPQVKFVDRVVEREVVVDTVEKKVPKVIEVPKYVDTVKYVWTPVEKIVHVERFVPVFDVSLECPAPLIVPYPVQAVKEMPAVMVRKAIPGATEDGVVVEEQHVLEVASPSGTVRVPEEYIQEYRRVRSEEQVCCGSVCAIPAEPQHSDAREKRTTGGICAGAVEEESHYITADEVRRLRTGPPPVVEVPEEAHRAIGEAFFSESVPSDTPRELLRRDSASSPRDGDGNVALEVHAENDLEART